MWETPKIPKQIVLTGSSWRNQWFFWCPMPKSWQIGWFRFKLATCRTAWARQAVIARFVSLPIFILQAQNRLRPSREFSCVVFFSNVHLMFSILLGQPTHACAHNVVADCALFDCDVLHHKGMNHGPTRKPTLFDSGRLGLPWFLYQHWT